MGLYVEARQTHQLFSAVLLFFLLLFIPCQIAPY